MNAPARISAGSARNATDALRVAALLLLALGAAACSLLRDDKPLQRHGIEVLSEDQQAAELRRLITIFTTGVESIGRKIAAAADDPETKRKSVFFRMWLIQSGRQSLWADTAAADVLDLWTLIVQAETLFREGGAKETFGPHQHIATGGLTALLRGVEEYAAGARDPELVQKARSDVYEFARRHPITGMFTQVPRPSTQESEHTGDLFSWVPRLSVNPFGGIGEGIGEGAAAVLEMRRTAERFTDVIEFLPLQIGWQLELMQYDLELAQKTDTIVAAISDSSASLERSVAVAEALPTQMRTEVEKLIESLDPRLETARAVLAEATETTGAADRAGATFTKTAASMEAMAEQLDTTLQTFHKLMELLVGDPDAPAEPAPEPGAEESRPFDILDYNQTAQSLGTAAANLDATLSSLVELIDNKTLPAHIEQVSDTTARTIWTAAGALIAAVLAILLLLLGYRRLAPRREA